MTVAEELWQLEVSYRARLRGRSLVMESEIPAEEALKFLKILGGIFFYQEEAEERRRVLRKYRAVLVVGLVAVGEESYEGGTLWTHISDAMGGKLRQGHENEIKDVWNITLDDFKLARFNTPMRYVGEILLHGGIPGSSIPAYVDALDRLDGMLPNMQPDQFIHRIVTLSGDEAYQMLNLSKPSWRFLYEAGEIATDYVERTLLAVDILREDQSSEDTCGLPENTFNQIKKHLIKPENKSRYSKLQGTKRRVNLTPTLSFDEHQGVRLVLPSLEVVAESTIYWRIDVDGDSRNVTAPVPFPGEPAKLRYWNITKPARSVVATASPTDHQWVLPLIDPDDPLMFFDGDSGNLLRSNVRLPKGRVWVAYPLGQDVNPIDEELEIDGSIIAVSQEITFYGWQGWAFRQVDLTNVSKLRLSADARQDLNLDGESSWRNVSSTAQPRLEGISPVPHVLVNGVRTVTSTLPIISIPGFGLASGDNSESSQQSQGPEWRIRLMSATDGRILHTWTKRAGLHEAQHSLWPEGAPSVIGVFDVELSGPLGKGFRERIAVCEGLAVKSNLDFRSMSADGNGLEPATVTLEMGNGEKEFVHLSSAETEVAISPDSVLASIGLSVLVPHMSVTLRRGKDLVTSITPAICEYESIRSQELKLNEPHGKRYVRLVAVLGEGQEQDVIERSRSETQVAFDLSQLADTLGNIRSCDIFREAEHERVLVARVQPKALAKGVELTDDGCLRLQVNHSLANLEAAIYPVFAPWKDPLILDLDGVVQSVKIEHDYLHSGEVIVVLRIQNPWSPQEWPSYPPEEDVNAFTLTVRGIADSLTQENQIQLWLSGQIEFPESTSGELLIKTYSCLLVDDVMNRLDGEEKAAEIASSLAHRATEIPLLINNIAESNFALQALLIESGLLSTFGRQPDAPTTLWDRLPLLALVLKAGMNQDGFGYSYARKSAFGAVVDTLMSGDVDPHATVGAFKSGQVEVLDRFSKEQLDAVMAAARAIPGRLLDKDERMIHARELFDVRYDPSITPLAGQSERILQLINECVRKELGEEGCAPIEARLSLPGWMSLPAVSIALALVNRLSARGNLRAQEIAKLTRSSYTKLSKAAPTFVEQDLVLAELWLSGWEESDGTN